MCRSFIQSHNNIKRLCCPLENHCAIPFNPVYIVTNKLKSFFLDLVVDDGHVFSEFKEFDNYSPLQDDQSGLVEVTRDDKTSLLDKALHCLQENACSFIMSGTDINFFFPPSSENHPISHKVIVVHAMSNSATTAEVRSNLEAVIDLILKYMCCDLNVVRKGTKCSSNSPAISTSDLHLFTSETIELKCGIQTKFKNLKNAASADIGCECGKLTAQGMCIFCRVEKKYLGYDKSPEVCVNNLFQPSTRTEMYHGERVILSCGVLDTNVVHIKTSQEHFQGWLMELNLDHLAMALFGICDIRLLWSDDERFKKQFSDPQVRVFINIDRKLKQG